MDEICNAAFWKWRELKYRPAIVPVCDVNEYLRLLTSATIGGKDLYIVRGPAVAEENETQVTIPVRKLSMTQEFKSLLDNGAIDAINDAINLIIKLIEKNKYRRVIFLADPPCTTGGRPPFRRGLLGYDVQIFITDILYSLGIYVYCKS